MSINDKYSAYLYLCAKQGLKTLSFNAWVSTHKKGNLL
jgi:hypothetical protein